MQGAYAPCIQMGKQIIQYEDKTASLALTMINKMNTIIKALNSSAIAGSTYLTPSDIKYLSGNLTALAASNTNEVSLKVQTGEGGGV